MSGITPPPSPSRRAATTGFPTWRAFDSVGFHPLHPTGWAARAPPALNRMLAWGMTLARKVCLLVVPVVVAADLPADGRARHSRRRWRGAPVLLCFRGGTQAPRPAVCQTFIPLVSHSVLVRNGLAVFGVHDGSYAKPGCRHSPRPAEKVFRDRRASSLSHRRPCRTRCGFCFAAAAASTGRHCTVWTGKPTSTH
jgi:hypothetical protein